MGRQELLVVVLVALAIVGLAWFLRTGVWKRGRLVVVALAVTGAVLVLSRRVGLGELLVVVAVLGIPLLLVARRAPDGQDRR
jgi:hypothetical protein